MKRISAYNMAFKNFIYYFTDFLAFVTTHPWDQGVKKPPEKHDTESLQMILKDS